MADFKVIVVGSGLAGSLLATGLLNNNVQVEVYERLKRDAKREGYQIRLGASALMGMRACLTEKQKDRIVRMFGRSNGKFSSAPIIYDRDFKILLNANRFPAYEKSAPISRKILQELLAESVDQAGKLHYDKSFDRYEILKSGTPLEKVRVWFGDGTWSDCDVLVAADGTHSRINKQVGLDNLQTIASHWGFAAKNDLRREKFNLMSKELLQSPVGTMSNQRGLYFCAYLPDDQMSVSSTSIATPKFDESASSCFLGYSVPTEDIPESLYESSSQEKWDFIRQQFRKYWSPKFLELIDALDGSDIHMFQGVASTKPPARWRDKARSAPTTSKETGHPRVMLVGDAIHAMLPNRGMGGNQAMRDASVLLPILINLNRLAKTTGNKLDPDILVAACRKYEAEMIPRTFDWVKKSGGSTVMLIDTATYTGSMWISLAAVFLDIQYIISVF